MQSYKPLDAVVFEPLGVLVDSTLTSALDHWSTLLHTDRRSLEERVRASGVLAQLEIGQAGSSELVDALGGDLSPDDLREGWARAVGDPLPGMMELVERFSASLRLIALTNVNEWTWAILQERTPELLGYFERVVTSLESGARKPDDGAYDAVLMHLEVEPDEIAFFDADPECVFAASACGMRAFEAGDAETMASDLEPLINVIPGSD